MRQVFQLEHIVITEPSSLNGHHSQVIDCSGDTAGKKGGFAFPSFQLRFQCFEGSEVYVRRDPVTGDVVLSRRPDSWKDFFELMKTVNVPEDFLADRQDAPPQKRKLF
jgi:antitoxin VapB